MFLRQDLLLPEVQRPLQVTPTLPNEVLYLLLKMSTSIIGDDWTKLALATLPRPHQGPPSQRKYLDQSQVELLTDLCRDYLSVFLFQIDSRL